MSSSSRFLTIVGAVVVLAACSSQSPTYTPPNGGARFYVTQMGINVLGYDINANGNATPPLQISGSGTQLASATAIVRDNTGRIYVSNTNQNQLLVFPPNVGGNVSPVFQVSGGSTQLNAPAGLAITSQGILLVTNVGSNAVTEYLLPANGNIVPTGTVAGASTTLNGPDGIAVDATGNIYVANLDANSITIFLRNCLRERCSAAHDRGTGDGTQRPHRSGPRQFGQSLRK
jgi:hypothetical protein